MHENAHVQSSRISNQALFDMSAHQYKSVSSLLCQYEIDEDNSPVKSEPSSSHLISFFLQVHPNPKHFISSSENTSEANSLLLCPVILLTLSGVKLWRQLKTEMLNKRHQQMSCALSSSFSCNFNASLQHDNIQPVQKKYKRRGVQMPHSWPLLLLKCP